MTTFIFTFPIQDPARRNAFCRVEAPDETTARLHMMDVYGRAGWSGCYLTEDDAGVAKFDLHEIEVGR